MFMNMEIKYHLIVSKKMKDLIYNFLTFFAKFLHCSLNFISNIYNSF